MGKLIHHPEKSARVAEILRALAHPLRIRIIALLCEKEEHVNALAERLQAPQAVVSQQLQILRTRGLVGATRREGFAFYRILEPQLKQLLQCVESCSQNEE